MTDIDINDYLPACRPQGGTCGSGTDGILLHKDCPVHGDLTTVLAEADDKVTEKTVASAKAHLGASVAWNNITADAADFFEGIAAKLRGGGR